MASRHCRYSGFSRLRKLARHQIMKTWPIFSSSVSLCRGFSAHFSPLRSRRSGPACWYLSFAKAIDTQVRTSSKVVSLWRIGEKDSRSGDGSKSLLPLGLRFSKRLSRRAARWQGSRIVEYGELDLLLHRINAVDQHPYAVAHAVSFASALSNNLPRVLVIQVTVVVEGVEWHDRDASTMERGHRCPGWNDVSPRHGSWRFPRVARFPPLHRLPAFPPNRAAHLSKSCAR